jgi:hypothetical protein
MNTNRTKQIADDQNLADGLTKNAGSLGTFGFGGKQLKPADVVQVLQNRITTAKAASAAKASLIAAAKAADDELTSTRALIKAVKQALRALFVDDIATLATFGLAPAKVTNPTPQTKVNAAAKAKATRKARGTKGKKARLAIQAPVQTGNETAPAAPEAPATPAPAPVAPPATPVASGTPAPAPKPQA